MAKILVSALSLMILLSGTAFTQDDEEEFQSYLGSRHQFGVRIGTWINTGEDPPELVRSADGFLALEADVSNVNFYFEGRFAYNVFPQAFIEFTVGIVNRGSVTMQEGIYTDISNLMLYPFLLRFKYYPINSVRSRIQPYLSAGGGLYHGRQSIQFTTDDIYFAMLNEDSETDFNYVLGGGAEYVLTNKLALDFNFTYMPINFSNPLVLIEDYSAFTVTVGITYLYSGRD